MLFQQYITILLQPCVVNLTTFFVVPDMLEQHACNKSDTAMKLQVVNSLFQTCYNNWEQAVRTQLVDSLWTDL
jgi:hypothetical protein